MKSVLFNQTDDKGNNCDDGKNKEQDFGNFNGARSDAAKAEKCSDKCDDQKNYGIMQHVRLLN